MPTRRALSYRHIMTLDQIIALGTLTAMEIVLGIDNIIFIAILVAKLPEHQQAKARQLGISLALILRVGLLFSLSWMMRLTEPLFTIASMEISGRDLILLFGGLFLIAKSTFEIHERMELTRDEHAPKAKVGASFTSILLQILALDVVFSLDSVITAVGMANQISIMVAAMLISMVVMLLSASSISSFVERHPTIKVLALSFLLMIGVMLVMEGLGNHINKGYIYFAMGFSLAVEMVNMRVRKGTLAQKIAGTAKRS